MFKGFFNFRRQIAITLDILVIIGSFVAAYFIRLLILKFIPFGDPIQLGNYWEVMMVIIFLWWWILSLQGAYTSERFTSLHQEVKTAFQTTFLGTLILLSGAFLLKLYPPRSLIVIFAGVNFFFLALEKTAIYYLINHLSKNGYHKKSVIIVGTGRKAREFIDSVRDHPSEGLEIVGFIDGEGEFFIEVSRGERLT